VRQGMRHAGAGTTGLHGKQQLRDRASADTREAHEFGESPGVISLLRLARKLGRALAAVWRNPDTKALPLVAGALLLTGTIFYWRFEDWTIIEALYFSVATLTTVGYGDFTPTTTETQIFTVMYILIGFGVLAALLTSVAHEYVKLKTEGDSARERMLARRHRRAGEG
jgi:voltage-gated potassium channel